jgi:DNA adenine methylase
VSQHKTPLRYPGGKGKLAPFITEIMKENSLLGGEYAEPFAGGSGVAIELLLSGAASSVHLNDASTPIFSFWYAILSHTDDFCRRIKSASLTVEEWERQRAIFEDPEDHSILDVGFAAFYLNRCNRSGIMSGGVIGGYEQTGTWKMDARFPRNEMVRRIEAIAIHRDCIYLYNLDAEQFIRDELPGLSKLSLTYFDPPYFRAGKRLYLNHYLAEDHARLAKLIQSKLKQHWIVSYDNTAEVTGLYEKRRSFVYDLQYNAAKAYVGKEFFAFSDKLKIPGGSRVASIDKALTEMSPVN